MSIMDVSATVGKETYILEPSGDCYDETIVAPDKDTLVGISAEDDYGNVAMASRMLNVNTTWIAPKTNWKPTDYFNIEDYARIVGNLRFLHSAIEELYPEFDIGHMDPELSYSSYIYAGTFNTIERNLTEINRHSYSFNIGAEKIYLANKPTPDYAELNRIEDAILKIRNTVVAEEIAIPKLNFRLGGSKAMK